MRPFATVFDLRCPFYHGKPTFLVTCHPIWLTFCWKERLVQTGIVFPCVKRVNESNELNRETLQQAVSSVFTQKYVFWETPACSYTCLCRVSREYRRNRLSERLAVDSIRFLVSFSIRIHYFCLCQAPFSIWSPPDSVSWPHTQTVSPRSRATYLSH